MELNAVAEFPRKSRRFRSGWPNGEPDRGFGSRSDISNILGGFFDF